MTKETKKAEKKTVEKFAFTQPLLTGAKLDKEIKSIAVDANGLATRIHVAAVSALAVVGKSGDIRPAIRLIEALPDMTRKNALRDWMQAFGPVSYNEEAKTLEYNASKPIMLQDAKDMPFWKFKPEAAYVPMDILKEIERIVSRAAKLQKQGKEVKNADKISALAKIA